MTALSANSSRPIVGREALVAELSELFHRHTDSTEDHEQAANIAVIHGIGAIGKTELCKLLGKKLQLEREDLIWIGIDFQHTQYRRGPFALYTLRDAIGRSSGMSFWRFDTALAFYWQRTNSPYKVDPPRTYSWEASAFGESVSMLLKYIPIVKTIREIILDFLKGFRLIRGWWGRKSSTDLRVFCSLHDERDMDDALISLFAREVTQGLQGRPLCIYFDSYEQLFAQVDSKTVFSDATDWLQRLIQSLPQAFWLICSRQSLDWDEYVISWSRRIVHCSVDALKTDAVQNYLLSRGIVDHQIIDHITKSSHGVPLHMRVAADYYFSEFEKTGEPPRADDIPTTFREVLACLCRGLGPNVYPALKKLAIPRGWSLEILKILEDAFKLPFRIIQEDLCDQNLVYFDPAVQRWNMHEIVRAHLIKDSLEKDVQEMHEICLTHYSKELAVVDEKRVMPSDELKLDEGTYHALSAYSPSEVACWTLRTIAPFYKAARWNVLSRVLGTVNATWQARQWTEDLDFGRCLLKLTAVYRCQGKDKERRVTLRRAQQIFERYGESNGIDYAGVLMERALAHGYNCEYESGIALIKRSLTVTRNALGERSEEYARLLNILSNLYSATDQQGQALAIAEETLHLDEKIGKMDSALLAVHLNDLAMLVADSGDYRRAEVLYDRALKILDESRSRDHPIRTIIMNNVAFLYNCEGKFDRAAKIYEVALQIDEVTLGEDHRAIAVRSANLATVYANQGRFDEAEALLRNALRIDYAKAGRENLGTAIRLSDYSYLRLKQERFKEAEGLALASLRVMETHLVPHHRRIRKVYRRLAEICERMGRRTDAERYRQLAEKAVASSG